MAKENEEFMRKAFEWFRYSGFILIAIDLYCYLHPFIGEAGLTNQYVDLIMERFARMRFGGIGLFSAHGLPIKILSAACLLASCLNPESKHRKTRKEYSQADFHRMGIYVLVFTGLFLSVPALLIPVTHRAVACLYAGLLIGLPFLYCNSLTLYMRKPKSDRGLKSELNDVFNDERESFPQNETLMENEYSVNLPMTYCYAKQTRKGWINVVNPFRATSVLGTPGSGKSFSVVNQYIRQHIAKGFCMFCYDFKFPDLSDIVYTNYRMRYGALIRSKQWAEPDGMPVPRFYVINFDEPERSHRSNPIDPRLMDDITDAYESAQTILFNLNRTWAGKQGDFFPESAVNLLTAVIWYLKGYNNGTYCTFPHVIEFLSAPYKEWFPILMNQSDLTGYMSPFMGAWKDKAMEQLQGQIASVSIPLSRLSSKQLYWVMSGNDFTLDINNPDEPKILCVGNNPVKAGIYGAALGLYHSRIIRLCNQKHKRKFSMIIDELPTVFIKGIDQLINTARSNKVSILLAFQDYAQLIKDYTKTEADVIINTVGNLFSGQVLNETAEKLSKRYGRNRQKKVSETQSDNSVSTSISTQMDTMIPVSKIANLSQGCFVGSVADDRGSEIEYKVFHCDILVDEETIRQEKAQFGHIPKFVPFPSGVEATIDDNFKRIKQEVQTIIENETRTINN